MKGMADATMMKLRGCKKINCKREAKNEVFTARAGLDENIRELIFDHAGDGILGW